MRNKIQLNNILERKGREKLVCLTAYTFPMAKILDEFCDIILVGDSLGMAIYGFDDTVDVELAMMIDHGRAVMKAVKKAFVVVDLPCGTYEESNQQALESALAVIEATGCDAIKIEVTPDLIKRVKFLTDNEINVMGHVGLLPQHVRELGGYKYQGKDQESAQEILQTAKLIEQAGAFALVIEAVPAVLADNVTRALKIPTIGIGASLNCDGQILVIDDLLGLNQEFKPKFVEYYANLAGTIAEAVKNFSKDVKDLRFPTNNNLR
jgi:3-methyl-2-oxobutanoate hydroxymethyltransferase